MLGSKLGYITLFWVADEISYPYCEYPEEVPALLVIIISLTVWTPLILSNLINISLNKIGWLICHLFLEKYSCREVIHDNITLTLADSSLAYNITMGVMTYSAEVEEYDDYHIVEWELSCTHSGNAN